MDDALGIPHPRAKDVQEGDEHSSGDEDGGLDWTRLPKLGAAARPVIPKRGEKDFEPGPGGGSGLQLHVLDRSRDAMFEALRATRTISNKNISYGIWYPSIHRVHVTIARGIHFSTMGHSISRTMPDNESRGSSSKFPRRLELLPEEALYLIERGSLFCYKSISTAAPLIDPSSYEMESPGAPISVQQAFTEMIGREDLTLERYQVYAYLKRLGFSLIRADPPTPEYPIAPPVSLTSAQPQQGLTKLFSCLVLKITSVVRRFHKTNWWRRLQLHQKTIHDIFKALRFIPCGHATPLCLPAEKSQHPSKPSASSPYKVFFHVYKPSTSFRKTTPPAPDFHIVIVDARTTSMPSLQELTALFDTLPEMPLPPSRRRGVPAPIKRPDNSQPTDVRPATPRTVRQGSPPRTMPSRPALGWPSTLWTFFRRSFPPFCAAPSSQGTKPALAPPKPNPFLALKTGKKTVVIAAVDAGNISFFRFGQGAFEEWPMI